MLLQTWDFGGQREYYVMHHLFLTNRGVYLVVLNLELWLSALTARNPEEWMAQRTERRSSFLASYQADSIQNVFNT